jgi:tRNA-dihydrouridine synthase B
MPSASAPRRNSRRASRSSPRAPNLRRCLAAYEKWRAPFLDARGELQARYRPDPMVATFMLDPDDPAVLRRDSIPVPKGPVDVW